MALTNKPTGRSIFNLFNPFSGIYNDDTYVPKSLYDTSVDHPNSTAAEAIWKGVTGLVGVGALAAAIRFYKGALEKDTTFTSKPMNRYLDTTTGAPIGVSNLAAFEDQQKAKKKKQQLAKTASEEDNGGRSWVTDFTQFALPAAGVIGGSVLGYNLADRYLEKRDATEYDKQIKEKTALVKRLVAARALQARGKLDDANYNSLMTTVNGYTKKASLNKEAGWWKDVQEFFGGKKERSNDQNWLNSPASMTKGTAGLLLLLTAATTAYMSKQYFDANDPARIKEKALRNGLEVYSKERMFNKPIYTASPEQGLFDRLNAAQEQKETPLIPSSAVSLMETPQAAVSVPL